jgi:ABC-type antimicrobial peptide transport system permease subunit
VTGIGFVPAGPHNEYSDGAWLTPGGYDRLFSGAKFPFKFHLATVTLRPGADVQAVAHRLDATAAAIPGGKAFTFDTQPVPAQVQALRDVAVLPLALAAFLILLAVAAVGHALSSAVRHRRHELAVLRALGMTRGQSRLVLITQASLLAIIGLAFGIPLGLFLGRALWREAADLTPVTYFPPVAVWALLLIAPAALAAAIVLAAWPSERAARLRPGQLLRAE